MDKVSNKEACQLAVQLIESQLAMMSIAISNGPSSGAGGDGRNHATKAGSDSDAGAGAGDADSAGTGNAIHLPRKGQPLKVGLPGSTVTSNAEAEHDLRFEHQTLAQLRETDPSLEITYRRILAGNALLAVEAFLKKYDIAVSRTPEIQFLGHACNAIINLNKFHIEPGYIPVASFDGLTIDSTLDGAALFDDGINTGFMASGDAVALLQWLAHHLRGERAFVSGGDAG